MLKEFLKDIPFWLIEKFKYPFLTKIYPLSGAEKDIQIDIKKPIFINVRAGNAVSNIRIYFVIRNFSQYLPVELLSFTFDMWISDFYAGSPYSFLTGSLGEKPEISTKSEEEISYVQELNESQIRVFNEIANIVQKHKNQLPSERKICLASIHIKAEFRNKLYSRIKKMNGFEHIFCEEL